MKQILHYLLITFQILSNNFLLGFNQDLNENYFLLNYGNPDVIQQQTGHNLTLKCGIKGHDAEYIQGTVIKWYFKPCGQNLKTCQNSFFDDWISIICDTNNICNSTLFLSNITEENSGLYKCTIYPYKTKKDLKIHLKSSELTTLDIQLVQTFQLYVRNTTILPPEFIDENPKNMTAKIDDQIVLQCWVHSKEPPTIRWFKRIPLRDNNNYINQNQNNQYSTNLENYSYTISYLENTYEFLNTAGVKVLTEDLYLSKLILNSLTKTMEGFYACVPINSRGHKIREAYVKIDENLNDIPNNINYMKYYSLFLMPIGLALLPLSFWLCYLCFKKYIKHRSYIHKDEEISLRINL